MNKNINRRQFVTLLGGVGLSSLRTGVCNETVQSISAVSSPAALFNVDICNPLLRTPLSIIIDDSCPVINKAYYWIKQRHDWRLRHCPNTAPSGWEIYYDRLDKMPNTIPAAFAAKWGEWCAGQGIRGKFSMVPFPAGEGRIDKSFPGFPESELVDWLRVVREIIRYNFDITPEMLTHTRVVDLKTWQLTEAWEQFEWVDPPVDQLTDYIATAMQLLKNVGITCEGVTSPGSFGQKKEDAYAKAVLDASIHVNNNSRPFYFLSNVLDKMPEIPIRHIQKDKGVAIASIVSCAGDWFGATGYGTANPDLFITEDLQGGRLPAVLKKELPTITIWMKNSEIGRYWMAKQLSDIEVRSGNLHIHTQFPTVNFTLSLDIPVQRIQVKGNDLRQISSRRNFQSGTFLVEGKRTYIAFDLSAGETVLNVTT